MAEQNETEYSFQEHIRGKLLITRSERAPKIEAEVSVSLSSDRKDEVIPIVLEKMKELLEGSQKQI